MRRAAIPALLPLLVLASCGGDASAPPAAPDAPAAPATPTPEPPPAPDAGGMQRAWGGRLGDCSVIAMAGSDYVAKVRESIPALVLVLRITNGTPTSLPLERERDEVVIELRDGTRVARADIWSRADWMVPLAGMPPEERARFVYPDMVLPGASVDVNVTFDTAARLEDVARVRVKLAALPFQEAWLQELAPRGR